MIRTCIQNGQHNDEANAITSKQERENHEEITKATSFRKDENYDDPNFSTRPLDNLVGLFCFTPRDKLWPHYISASNR